MVSLQNKAPAHFIDAYIAPRIEKGGKMNALTAVLSFVIGYLAGGISFTRLVSRLVNADNSITDVEIPMEGTDETYKMEAMGASTAAMVHGPKVGCTIGLLDMLKVFVPTLIFRLLYPDQPYMLICAVAGVIGHDWPIYHKFKGGRGISAVYGGLFAVDWLSAIISSSLGMFFGMVILKDFMFAYFAGLWFLIPVIWFVSRDPIYILYAVAMNILFTLAMVPDIRQIIRLRKKLGGKGSMDNMMNMVPMGRSMKKLGEKLRLVKKQPTQPAEDE